MNQRRKCHRRLERAILDEPCEDSFVDPDCSLANPETVERELSTFTSYDKELIGGLWDDCRTANDGNAA